MDRTPHDPPKIARRFLHWFCDRDLLEDVDGDLLELFHLRADKNLKGANWRYVRDVILLFRPGIIRQIKPPSYQPIMIKNYILIALRSALKYKGHTLLNLTSLIIGVAACLLMLLWINDELSIDQFHEEDDRLYQVWRNMHQANGEVITTPGIPQPMAVALRTKYPEVDEVSLVSWDVEALFKKDDQTAIEVGKYVSPEFFRIFSFPMLLGDVNHTLEDMNSVAISERLAIKYFGKEWASTNILDEVLTIGSTAKDYKISGVFADPGPNSSLVFDWVRPAQEYIQDNSWVTSWYNGGFRIYFTLKPGADIASLGQKTLQEINENTNYDADERIYLRKFSDNYLLGTWENGIPVGGRIQYVRILFIIAIFILIIACINFMNLATARSSRRTREIGVRKVLGARRKSLRQQFMVESFVLAAIAVLAGVLLVFLALPSFNRMTDKSLFLDLTNPAFWITVGLITLVTGALSGSYPAFLMPSFKIIPSLKGTPKIPGSGVTLRQVLVVFQFAVSIALIIGTLVVSQQINYILNRNLGLNKENLIFTALPRSVAPKMELYKTALLNVPEINQVTSTSGNPIDYGRSSGSAQWEGKDPNEEVEINVLSVDHDFVQTMEIEMVRGRDFSLDFSTDTSNYLINEVTAKIMGFENPIDKDLTLWGQKGKIVGVVKDFHMSSMYEPIAPLIIRCDPTSTFVAFIRTQGNVQNALKNIERIAEDINPGYPFEYEFLDQNYAAAYRSEMTLYSIVNIFAFISILISCLGLFGLSSFTAEQRSKEIGIRKVYGANTLQIVSMLSWNYTKLILIAFIISAPLAYYVMTQWLGNFEFKIDLKVMVLLTAGLATFAIGAITVGLKSWRAALVNPIRSLREE